MYYSLFGPTNAIVYIIMLFFQSFYATVQCLLDENHPNHSYIRRVVKILLFQSYSPIFSLPLKNQSGLYIIIWVHYVIFCSRLLCLRWCQYARQVSYAICLLYALEHAELRCLLHFDYLFNIILFKTNTRNIFIKKKY